MLILLDSQLENRDIHQTVPDHRVKLTQEGQKQAREAGKRLRGLLKPDDTLHFFTSPYRRTRETTEGILESLTSDDPSPSPFQRQSIKVYEEPRLREQDFGNFQPCSAEMERMWQERADYGHFFYRIPNGESAADAYDRISGFNESLWRYFGEDDFASVCVLVTHGLMTRVFLMKWYHFTVEYFEDLRNINHCEFVVMTKQPESGKYLLENHLRTWSELRRERQAQAALCNGPTQPLKSCPENPASHPFRKRWGGCPDGCNHKYPSTRRSTRRQNTADLTRDEHASQQQQQQPLTTTKPHTEHFLPSEDEDDPRGRLGTRQEETDTRSRLNIPGLSLDLRKSTVEEIISSPDGTPSYITPSDRLPDGTPSPFIPTSSENRESLGGRDGGGSASGVPSSASSCEDSDCQSPTDNKQQKQSRSLNLNTITTITADGQLLVGSGMAIGAQADALGDQESKRKSLQSIASTSSTPSTPEEEEERTTDEAYEMVERELEREEKKEGSVRESVY
ncbi:MAG: hypothetical protein M1834_009678 [Cirrosporium novae-zelandiae]|nr:MAG: hypothetical protein M1834_009678 [Cirrosporium novae-zelandiae]